MKRFISTRWGDILTPPSRSGNPHYPQRYRPMQAKYFRGYIPGPYSTLAPREPGARLDSQLTALPGLC